MPQGNASVLMPRGCMNGPFQRYRSSRRAVPTGSKAPDRAAEQRSQEYPPPVLPAIGADTNAIGNLPSVDRSRQSWRAEGWQFSYQISDH